ncbi:sugar transferase [uncultured Litoreibacter sp.]|uniref:sugar transferase n=1 Tax=uncultured Litoreibacter sp. TaxID=1392394 RepID=UPI002623A654|nr:sugar transferase [uncultured Litoreibacter sp.]
MDVRVARHFENAEPVNTFNRLPAQNAPLQGGLYCKRWKRALDILLVLATLPLSLPLLLVGAFGAVLDGGPAFYTQPRLGRDGKVFRMLKLRTMRVNAEQQLTDILMTDPNAAIEWHQTQKLRQDPRITAIGRVLRKTSLDELPQIWNVLKGEMSLVGPRPMLREQAIMYPGTAYHRLLPGVTGPWQVFGRNDESFSSRAKYDAMYERETGFLYDLSLICRTVGVVLWGTGR